MVIYYRDRCFYPFSIKLFNTQRNYQRTCNVKLLCNIKDTNKFCLLFCFDRFLILHSLRDQEQKTRNSISYSILKRQFQWSNSNQHRPDRSCSDYLINLQVSEDFSAIRVLETSLLVWTFWRGRQLGRELQLFKGLLKHLRKSSERHFSKPTTTLMKCNSADSFLQFRSILSSIHPLRKGVHKSLRSAISQQDVFSMKTFANPRTCGTETIVPLVTFSPCRSRLANVPLICYRSPIRLLLCRRCCLCTRL